MPSDAESAATPHATEYNRRHGGAVVGAEGFSVDIHGTDHSQFQRAVSAVVAGDDGKAIIILLAQPITDEQFATLMEHLRSWHP